MSKIKKVHYFFWKLAVAYYYNRIIDLPLKVAYSISDCLVDYYEDGYSAEDAVREDLTCWGFQ